MPVTTLADGTAIAIIVPYFAFNAGWAVNNNVLPFSSVASGSSTFPYAAAPSYNAVGPFNTQIGNAITYAIDSVQVDFINTQSSLNVQGRL
jgi:hypothetical protein